VKVLLTGATGFIGKALISEFISSGYQVIALVRNLSSELPEQVEQMILEDWSVLSIEALAQPLGSVLRDLDVVVHAAARAHIMREASVDPLAECMVVNRNATLTIAQLAVIAGVKRFVFLSSIGVNGNQNSQPFLETDKPNPQEPYAVSKYEAEQGLLEIAKQTQIEVVIIRPPLVYGLNAPGNFARLLKWVSNGSPLPFGAVYNQRSLVALDNLVSFIIHCIDHPKAANEVFLISDGEDVSTTELLQKVAKAFDKKAILLPVPVSLMKFAAKLLGKADVADRLFGSLQVDSSKARDLLGWKPVISMDDQLKKTAEAYQKK
jgi:nucleoside-diphosphate-sugar epimerase